MFIRAHEVRNLKHIENSVNKMESMRKHFSVSSLHDKRSST